MWTRLSNLPDMSGYPKAGKFLPVAVSSRGGKYLTCTALWTQDADGNIVWFGADGKRITAQITAWYAVPEFTITVIRGVI